MPWRSNVIHGIKVIAMQLNDGDADLTAPKRGKKIVPLNALRETEFSPGGHHRGETFSALSKEHDAVTSGS